MTIPVIDWPVSAYRIRSEDWHLAGQTVASSGLFGPSTVIHVENRVWRLSLDLSVLFADQLRLVRAVLDEARGRYAVIRVPVCTVPPVLRSVGLATTWDDGITFDGGIAWAAETADDIEVLAAAPEGATLLRINSGAIGPGAMFTLPGDRLYRVAGYARSELRINPPLRAPIAKGDRLEFARPFARMRLDSDVASITRDPASVSRPRVLRMVEA